MSIWDEVALIEATAIRDIPVSTPLEPNRLSDSGRYHGYLIGCNTQDEYVESQGSTVVAWYGGERGQAFAIDRSIAHAVQFNYLKPAHGYKGPKASYLAMINATARRLDLPAYTRKSEFDANCAAFKVWVDSLDFRGAATTGVTGSWGDVGVAAVVIARSIGQCYHVVYGQTIPISHVYATVKHGRNAYGVVFGYDTFSDLGQAQFPLIEHSYHVSNGYALSGYPGDTETPEGLGLQELLDRRSRLYEYLRLQHLQQTGDSTSQPPSGGGSNMAIPWVTIITFLLSFFLTKSKTGSNSKAVLAAALVGGATYAYTHSDFAAGSSLAEYDGVENGATPLLNADSTPAKDAKGQPILTAGPAVVSPDGGLISNAAGVLKSWGATGTATVIGTSALATSSSLQKYLPLILIGGAVLILSR